MHDVKFNRRQLLRCTLLGSASVGLLQTTLSEADGLLPITPSDVTARGLDYHANANSIDRGDYPEYEASQHCASCVHFIDSGNQHGCKLMPGKEVNANGWCKVWTAKP